MAEENKQFKLPEGEERILKFWDERKIFEKSLEQTRRSKPFAFYDGPPFATGLPHYGHLLASTVKDVFGRYQTMRGRYVRRRWGWDCHGLPIEEVVERKLGISGKKQIEQIGIKKFNETCRSMVLEYAGEWKETIRRLGRWVEFDDSYKTMDSTYMESVWWAFKEIYKKGLVYEGRKVLLYCPRCETPVSNFEVAMDNSYKDVTEESVTVKFKVKNPGKIGLGNKDLYILAWTTTPWTLPGNVALAVGSEIRYRIVRSGNEYLIAAVDRLKDIGLVGESVEFGQELTGADLVGLGYVPLFNVPEVKNEKSFRVYPASFVTTTDGTGIVHTAVVYGEDDYNLGVQVGLPVVPMLDEKGTFNDKAPEFLRGQYFKKADGLVIADLEKRNLVFKKESYTHSYPHCWRCGNMLFYNAIPAWFFNIQKIKPKLIKSNSKEINWFPEHLKHGRYEKSIEAAPDWNISRNRYWGNPIPAWKCDKCGQTEIIGSIDELSARVGKSKNEYWIMRHGEAETNVFDVTDSGQGKFHLTPLGERQAKEAIDKFGKELSRQGKRIDLIIASDILRTKETAKIDDKELGGESLTYDERLREINLGPILNGCHDEKYHQIFPTYQEKFEKRPQGGESLRDLRKRLWEFLADCETKYEGKNILIVTHEYPAWMLAVAAGAMDERQAIVEKEKYGKDYINFAEIRKLGLRIAPRNDTGEVDLHRPYIDAVTFACRSCGGKMRRTTEIFDSWVEAGSMPFAEFHYPFDNKKVFEARFPGQFVAEYIAQTRAWFYVMHVISLILFGEAPFENVVTTGTILAEDGSKMSKSKGNYPDPKIVLARYGADSLRFYLMNSVVMQADNLDFSEKGVEGIYRKVELLIANVYKFFATYASTSNATATGDEAARLLDLWIKVRTEELVTEVTKYLDVYDTVRATRAVQEYVDDLSTWYLRRSRKRDDRAFFNTLHDSLLTLSKVIAPFMPFLADDLYGKIKSHDLADSRAESVHLTAWPKASFSMRESKRRELTSKMAEVRRLASLGLAGRERVKIKIRQPLSKMSVKGKVTLNSDMLNILKDEVNVKEVVFDPDLVLPEDQEIQLDTNLTEELKEEGVLREMTRLIQGLRREAGLVPTDTINLHVQCSSAMQLALEQHLADFRDDIGAREVLFGKSDKFTAEKSTQIDGEPIWVGIAKL
ncbi:class I tRNA ligase family protein [Patescibacteria group bacterium]|nr:class I tRNA ligase family protein [Patescibacteria group bacterium]